MKRINGFLIIMVLVIACTGCSIDYKIEITKETIKENIAITDLTTNKRTKEIIYSEYQNWVPVYVNALKNEVFEYDGTIKIENVEYHNKNITELENGYNYTYSYNYPISTFEDASSIRQMYSNKRIYMNTKYITINTDKINLLCNYDYFDDIKITISIDENYYKVNHTNGEKIANNQYVWHMNKTNCDDSEILLTLDKVIKTSPQKTNMFEKYALYIFCIILIVLILIGYLIFKKLKNKNEKFDIDD